MLNCAAQGNGRRTQRMYRGRFPQRRCPHYRTFSAIYDQVTQLAQMDRRKIYVVHLFMVIRDVLQSTFGLESWATTCLGLTCRLLDSGGQCTEFSGSSSREIGGSTSRDQEENAVGYQHVGASLCRPGPCSTFQTIRQSVDRRGRTCKLAF